MIRKIGNLTIRTERDRAVIIPASHEWCAVDDDTYEGEGCAIGYGPTEQDAIEDLLWQLEG